MEEKSIEFKLNQIEIARIDGPLPVTAVESGTDKTGAPVTTYTCSLMKRRGVTIKVKVSGQPVITDDEIEAYLDAEGVPPLVQFAEDFAASFYAFLNKSGSIVSGISARASSATLVTGKGGAR